jgi:PRC-barrel domain
MEYDMIKPSGMALIAVIAATAQFAGAVAFSQTTVTPKSEPKFGPSDIPEPNGPALRFGPKDIPEPNGPALVPAQTSPPTAMPPTAPVTPDAPSLTLTDAQVKAWLDKAVYSSDGKKIGEVAAFARDGTGKVTEMHADIGGFLGMGETRIRLMPAQFKMDADRIVLNVTADQAKAMPPIKK